jgi:hypothetical protein
VDFDCLTEFWVADRADQARTARFVTSPEFSVLDDDDRRFLDVTRRLSFEVEERTLAGSKPHVAAPGALRLALFIERSAALPAAEFAAHVGEQASRFATHHAGVCDAIALDLRRPLTAEEAGMAAILSVWPAGGRGLGDLAWPEFESPTRVAQLESIRTPPEALFSGPEQERASARTTPPDPVTVKETDSP